jgi:flagellar protein FlbD
VIELNRLHGNGTFFVNPDLIETIEARPDTTVTLVNKHRYVVEDPVGLVIERIIEFRARIAGAAGTDGDRAAGARSLAAIEDQHEEQAA